MPTADETSMSVDIPYLDVVYTASTQSVMCPRLAQLLCRYVLPVMVISTVPTSEFHQYCQRILRQYYASNMSMFGSTGITPRLQLAQYPAGSKNCLTSDFSTWVITIAPRFSLDF